MSVEETSARMRLLLARRSAVTRRLAAGAGGPDGVRSPRLDGMPRGHGARGDALAVLGRMEALAAECAEIENTVLGRYMEHFAGCSEGSIEYQALCEGVDALLESRK